MAKFNKKVAKRSIKTVNKAGGFAFKFPPETELVHAVLTTFLEDKFYESGEERLERIQELVRRADPQFVANLATVARKEFHLRSVTHVLLGELAKTHTTPPGFVKDVIVRSTERVDDLTELASYVGLPMPKQIKRGIRNALLKFNRYQLAKYRGEGSEMSLVDLFNLVHPKAQFASKEQREAWRDLMEGNLVSFDTWETEISNAKDDKARKKVWESLIAEGKLGYMALLRNLNNLVKYEVSGKTIVLAVDQLTDSEAVKKSKQLPFRFYTAYQNVDGNTQLKDAVSEAMDLALANVPVFRGSTLIAVDVSGSMKGEAIEKASIFAAALLKSNPSAELVLFDTTIRNVTLSTRLPVVDLAKEINRLATGGGTETSLVFKTDKEYDRIIILSDNESWTESWRGVGVQSSYEAYKKRTGADPFVYAIDIQGYGTKDVTGSKVKHLTGWSDRLLDFIKYAEKGESLIDYIQEYDG